MPVTHTNKKVLVALSGGVDSSVAVRLLQRDGWEVEAVVLEFSPAHSKAVEAARTVAVQLGVKLHVMACHDEFFERVITPFCREYQAGRTPNPCIICNPAVKFHFICEKAKELGFPWIASGHYARIERREDGVAVLEKADCLPRDQSYMLYRLTQEQLSMLILPLQAMDKSEVRDIAAACNLASAQAPDSQEICWLPDGDYAAYIEEHFGSCPPGDFISPDGTICGNHRGLLHYTVGQRKHLGISLGYPVFVERISPEENRVYLARPGEGYASGVEVENCVFQPNSLLFPGLSDTAKVSVKVRSRAENAAATVTITASGATAVVTFDKPQRAPAPGQSCVFYDGSSVLGGGIIHKQI